MKLMWFWLFLCCFFFFFWKTCYRTLYIHYLHSHLQWVFAGAWQVGVQLEQIANWSYWSKLQDQSQGNIPFFSVFRSHQLRLSSCHKINNFCSCFVRDCCLRSPLCCAHMHKNHNPTTEHSVWISPKAKCIRSVTA